MVEELCDPRAKLDVVGVSEGAMRVAEFMDDGESWKKWGERMDAFAAVATYYHASDIKNKEFAHWLQEVCSFASSMDQAATNMPYREVEHTLSPRNLVARSLLDLRAVN